MKQKIAFVVSAPITARVFLAHQICVLANSYEVTVVTNMRHEGGMLDNLPSNVTVFSLPIARKISIFADLKALILLLHYFWRQNFILVHSVSPKAGLLSSFAGWVTRVPNRLHTFTGQVWATQDGFMRWLLKAMDKSIVRFSTNILVDSCSQRDFLVENSVLSESSAIVLNKGSISGVNLQRFHPSREISKSIRNQLGIGENDVVILFLGRLKHDKGVVDLAEAFNQIYLNYPNAVLLIIGPDEEHLKSKIVLACGDAAQAACFVPFTKRPEDYMAASDIFVLPSYREGFGSVVIEAAACAIPAVVSRIYGLTDAVDEGVTGLFFDVGDVKKISEQVSRLLSDESLRDQLGINAYERAKKHFSQELITDELCVFYSKLITNNSSHEY